MKVGSLSFAVLLLLAACQSQRQDAGYALFSLAYIEVKVPEVPTDTIYAEARVTMNIPRKASRSKLLEISDKGTYLLPLEIDRPVVSTLVINDTSLNVLVVPNDTVSIDLLFHGKKLVADFSGTHEEINEYLEAKQRAMGYSDLRFPLNDILQPGTKYLDVLAQTDSLVANEIRFLENYSSNRHLPDWFVQLETAGIIYTGAGFKQFVPYYNTQFELFEDTLPSNYYDFLRSVPINNEHAILSERYLWFLDDFFIDDEATQKFGVLSGYSRISKFVNYRHRRANKELTGNVKQIYNQYLFGLVCQYATDSLMLDSLAQVFEIEDVDAFEGQMGTQGKPRDGFKNLQAGDEVLNFTLVDANDSLVSLEAFRDKVVYINFWATWCGPCIKNFPALNQLILDYETRDDIVFLNVCLHSSKDTWLKMIRKEGVRGINLFPEGNWTELLTNEFRIRSFPTYVLLDKQNKLFKNHTDKAPLVRTKIDQLLK